MLRDVRDSEAVAFMSRHFVALTCLYELANATQTRGPRSLVISGFLLDVRDHYFWVTAGHCLKDFDAILASEGVTVHGGSFVDSFALGAAHKDPVPFRYEAGCGFYLCQPENGLDFALIPLNLLQVRAFAANKLVPVCRENWVRQRDLSFDFYRMLGIPAEKVETSLGDAGMVRMGVRQSMVSVERIGIEDLGEAPSDAEAAPTDAWFIGRLSRGCAIRDLKGMSGGPIYGFRRDGKGRLAYHVVALQSRWWNQSRTVFGCSVPLFAELVFQRMGKLTARNKRRKEAR